MRRLTDRRDHLGAAAVAGEAREGHRHDQAELLLAAAFDLQPVNAARDGGKVGADKVGRWQGCDLTRRQRLAVGDRDDAADHPEADAGEALQLVDRLQAGGNPEQAAVGGDERRRPVDQLRGQVGFVVECAQPGLTVRFGLPSRERLGVGGVNGLGFEAALGGPDHLQDATRGQVGVRVELVEDFAQVAQAGRLAGETAKSGVEDEEVAVRDAPVDPAAPQVPFQDLLGEREHLFLAALPTVAEMLLDRFQRDDMDLAGRDQLRIGVALDIRLRLNRDKAKRAGELGKRERAQLRRLGSRPRPSRLLWTSGRRGALDHLELPWLHSPARRLAEDR